MKPTKLQPFVSVTIFSFGEDRARPLRLLFCPIPLTSNHPQQHLADSCDALTSRQLCRLRAGFPEHAPFQKHPYAFE